MNYTKALLLIVCAMLLSLFDTSFFSSLPIFGATILSAYVCDLFLSVSKGLNIFLTYAIAVVFFFSIFSSLPIWFIVVGFLCLPYSIYFIRKKYFPKLSVFSSLPFFIAGTLIFSTILIAYNKDWNISGLAVLVYFTLLNSVLGAALYYLSSKWEKGFSRKEIKF